MQRLQEYTMVEILGEEKAMLQHKGLITEKAVYSYEENVIQAVTIIILACVANEV